MGVERFVNISTDKAANPTSELGRSKYVAERLTSHFAEVTGRPYVSVRFGNVLGSRGSVLISFTEQIRRGAPLTVTHPDVTRFFMTIPEACVLVLNAASEGAPGETMVLDMGDPVRIVDIAVRMMTMAGRSCPITYTGLRDGEKLHEELFAPSEGANQTPNGRAWRVEISGLEPAFLEAPDVDLPRIREAYSSYVGGGGDQVEHKAASETTEAKENPLPRRATQVPEPAARDAEPVGSLNHAARVIEVDSALVKESIR